MKKSILLFSFIAISIFSFTQGDSTLSPSARFGLFPQAKFLLSDSVTFFSKDDLKKNKPAMMMVFSDWPMYALYELAPRVDVRFFANDDIMLAGLTMKLLGDIPLWIALAVVFFRGTAERDTVDA